MPPILWIAPLGDFHPATDVGRERPATRSGARKNLNGEISPSPAGRFLVTGSGWIALTHIASKVALLVTVIVGARLLDVEEFGLLMSLYAVVLIASVVWDLGTSLMSARDVAAGELSLILAIRMILKARAWTLPLWAAVFACGVWAVGEGHPDMPWAVGLLALVSVAHNLSTVLEGFLHSQLHFGRSALAIAFGRAIQLLCLVPLIHLLGDRPFLALSAVFVVGEIVSLLLLAWALRSCSDPNPGRDAHNVSGAVRSTLARAAPYGLSGLFTLGYGKADLILVTILAGAFQAGLYAPATRLQDALMIIPAVVGTTMIPLSARAATGSRFAPSSMAVFQRGLRLSLAVSVAGAVTGFIAMPWLLPFVLGPGFADAVTPARILIWSIPLASVQATFLATLIGHGRASATTVIHGVALLSTGLAHLGLDGRYGAVGGAWASLSREPIALVVGWVLLWKSGALLSNVEGRTSEHETE